METIAGIIVMVILFILAGFCMYMKDEANRRERREEGIEVKFVSNPPIEGWEYIPITLIFLGGIISAFMLVRIIFFD